MNLNLIDPHTAVNLAAIASIQFVGNDEVGITAHVRFWGCGRVAGDPSEVFSGEAARRLREIVMGENGQSLEVSSGKPILPPSRPEFGRTKAWYYLSDADGRRYFMAYVNAKGSCSMRTFDAESGAFLTKKYRTGSYQTEFADFTRNAMEVTVFPQPNLERDCKERLPEATLAHLKKQVK